MATTTQNRFRVTITFDVTADTTDLEGFSTEDLRREIAAMANTLKADTASAMEDTGAGQVSEFSANVTPYAS